MTKPVKSTEHQSFLTASIGRVFSQVLEIHPKGSDRYHAYKLESIEQFVDSIKILGFDDKLLANYQDLSTALYNLNGNLGIMHSSILKANCREQAIEEANNLIKTLNTLGVSGKLDDIISNLKRAGDVFYAESASIIKEFSAQTEKQQKLQESAAGGKRALDLITESLRPKVKMVAEVDALCTFQGNLEDPDGDRNSAMIACKKTIQDFKEKAERIVCEHQSLLRKPLADNPKIIDIILAIVSIQKIKDRKRYVAKSFRQNTFVLLLFLMLAVGFSLTSYYSLGMHIPVVHMIIGMSFTGVSLLGLISVWLYQHTHAADYVSEVKVGETSTYSNDLLTEVALGGTGDQVVQMYSLDSSNRGLTDV